MTSHSALRNDPQWAAGAHTHTHNHHGCRVRSALRSAKAAQQYNRGGRVGGKLIIHGTRFDVSLRANPCSLIHKRWKRHYSLFLNHRPLHLTETSSRWCLDTLYFTTPFFHHCTLFNALLYFTGTSVASDSTFMVSALLQFARCSIFYQTNFDILPKMWQIFSNMPILLLSAEAVI